MCAFSYFSYRSVACIRVRCLLTLLLLLCLPGCSDASKETIDKGPIEDGPLSDSYDGTESGKELGRLMNSFLSLSNVRISQADLLLTYDAYWGLIELVEDGSIILVSQSDDGIADPQKVSEAEANLVVFLDALAQEGKFSETDGKYVVNEESFDKVMLSLCPLWPFC